MELSTSQAASALGVSTRTIQRACDDGTLHCRRQGLRRIIRIHLADLRAYADRHGYVIDDRYIDSITQ